jgi:hypothetical protein
MRCLCGHTRGARGRVGALHACGALIPHHMMGTTPNKHTPRRLRITLRRNASIFLCADSFPSLARFLRIDCVIFSTNEPCKILTISWLIDQHPSMHGCHALTTQIRHALSRITHTLRGRESGAHLSHHAPAPAAANYRAQRKCLLLFDLSLSGRDAPQMCPSFFGALSFHAVSPLPRSLRSRVASLRLPCADAPHNNNKTHAAWRAARFTFSILTARC